MVLTKLAIHRQKENEHGLKSYTLYINSAQLNQFFNDNVKNGVSVRVPIVVKRHHDHSSSYKEKHLIEVAVCSFRGLVH